MPSNSQKIKVVVVEDDAFISDILAQNLKDEFALTIVGTGQGFIDALDTSRPDIILLDIQLPDANGLDLLESLQKEEKYSDLPPVVIFSNHITPENKEHANRLGVIALVQKASMKPGEIVEFIKSNVSAQS